jgi:hypothetical protein
MKKFYLGVPLVMFISAGAVLAETKDTVNKEINFQAKDNGGYKSSAVTETLTNKGTKEIVKTDEDVNIAKDGQVTGTLKTDTRTNPKGLLNETWKQEEARNEIHPDGTAKLDAHSKSVDKEGTSVDSKLKTVSKVNADGTTRTTSNLTTTVDPKGMLNKSVLETNKVVDSKTDGSTVTHVEKKLDGKVVENTSK